VQGIISSLSVIAGLAILEARLFYGPSLSIPTKSKIKEENCFFDISYFLKTHGKYLNTPYH